MDGNVICNIGRNKFAVRNMKNQNFEISECWDPSDRHFRVLEPFQASFYNKQNNMNCLRYHKKSVSSKIRVAHGRPNFCFRVETESFITDPFKPRIDPALIDKNDGASPLEAPMASIWPRDGFFVRQFSTIFRPFRRRRPPASSPARR